MANVKQKEVAEEVVLQYYKSRLAFVENQVKSSFSGLSTRFWVSGKPEDIVDFLQSYGVFLERAGEDNVTDFKVTDAGDSTWKVSAPVTL
ncbi:hypothetical protein PP939_gp240 [Rhizobium phage RL38J1]|uniref:Uncharacterized protein n=1 Tax=Rhizobium phage RL38J1 TaxID=2663232 RepID=A0A6B9J6X5_9CAUD|nr:hypothetical protein PP939_gp240 [Rhizobium phage RL38J1]QGZ14011.1 hypothetical protein RL38J1_240 [Rhizobium phage RL38J1]